MNESTIHILRLIKKYIQENPSIRFGQALFNLGINEFADKAHPENSYHNLRDIYEDTDEDILRRIRKDNG